MQHAIVGSLLVIIIVSGGWLTYFYNKLTNKKILVDDSWEQLDLYLQKRTEMLLKTDPDPMQPVHQLKELEEKIEVCRYIYNDAVINYNKSLTDFPGTASGLILGLKKLPYFKMGEQEDEHS